MNTLFSKIPQGFKNFYPKLEKHSVETESESPKQKSSEPNEKRRSGNNNNKNNGKPPSEDPNPTWTRLIFVLGLGAGAYAIQVVGTRYVLAHEKYVLQNFIPYFGNIFHTEKSLGKISKRGFLRVDKSTGSLSLIKASLESS